MPVPFAVYCHAGMGLWGFPIKFVKYDVQIYRLDFGVFWQLARDEMSNVNAAEGRPIGWVASV